MSAYTVGHETIVVLLNALLDYGVAENSRDAYDLAEDLWRENVRSVNFRYSERNRTPQLTSHRIDTKALHPTALLAILNGWQYQACERNDFEKSKAFATATKLRAALIADGAVEPTSRKGESITIRGITGHRMIDTTPALHRAIYDRTPRDMEYRSQSKAIPTREFTIEKKEAAV